MWYYVGGYIDSTSESSVDAPSTNSSGESGSSLSQDGDTSSSGRRGGDLAAEMIVRHGQLLCVCVHTYKAINAIWFTSCNEAKYIPF